MESVTHIGAAEDQKAQKQRGGGDQGENDKRTFHDGTSGGNVPVMQICLGRQAAARNPFGRRHVMLLT
jgi:hypothetical protein